MRTHYYGCDIIIQSVVDIRDSSDIHVVSDEHATAWEDLYLLSIRALEDPNQAATEVAPSTPVPHEGETPSIPDTPHLFLIKETHLRKNQPLESQLELQ